MLDPSLRQHIEEHLLDSIIDDVRFCSGGSINDTCILRCQNGMSYFLKTHPSAPDRFFCAEQYGLELLDRSGVVRVPEVVSVGAGDGNLPQFILLEALVEGRRDARANRELGMCLARLHSIKAERYGLDRNNFIGLNSQINHPCDSWGEFFVRQRLHFQMTLGRRLETFTQSDEELLNKLEPAVVAALNATGHPPVLLHGDLWSGNVFWSDAGPVLIDPAAYYGDREADLAFTELFGGFDREFYRGYEEVIPFTLDYELRKTILNLYHVMNHANLFGGGYISAVQRTLTELAQAL